MGKTYRKEKPSSKRREEAQHGDKHISHDQERTERKRQLDRAMHHWDEDDFDERD